jgi:hypothetical protein
LIVKWPIKTAIVQIDFHVFLMFFNFQFFIGEQRLSRKYAS